MPSRRASGDSSLLRSNNDRKSRAVATAMFAATEAAEIRRDLEEFSADYPARRAIGQAVQIRRSSISRSTSEGSASPPHFLEAGRLR